MSNSKKPIKSFEITFFKKWYFVEVFSETKIEIYTENEKNIDEDQIKHLVKYLKLEGFIESPSDKQ